LPQRENGMASGDLTEAEWALVAPLLAMGRGRPGRASRRQLDGILWRAREGAGWRAVPERVEHGLAPLRPLARAGRP
jgi:transposase